MKKLYSLAIILCILFLQVEAKEQKYIPPKKFKQYCDKVMQDASGGNEGGSKQSDRYTTDKESEGKKGLDKISRMDFAEDYQKVWKVCNDGLKKLDKQCDSTPSSPSCHKRNCHMKVFHQIGISFDDTQNAPKDSYSTGKDAYDCSNKDLVKILKKETDPSNQLLGKDKKTTEVKETIKELQKKKNSSVSGEFKSKTPAAANKNNPTKQREPCFEDKCANKNLSNQKEKPKKVQFALNSAPSYFIWNLELQDLFLGKSFAATGKESSVYRNIKARFNTGIESNYGPKSRINEYDKNAIQTNRNKVTQKVVDSLQTLTKEYQEKRNHQTRLSNDIQGEGMAASHERFEKTMEMHGNTSKEMDKTIKALAQFCKNQAAKFKCWGDSNTPPQLPFPFGGGGGGGGNNEVSGSKDYPFIARYFCPDKKEKFSLKTKKGLWGSAITVSPKGIALTHKKPLEGFEFHEDGCLLSIQDKDRPKNFQIYKVRPEFYTGKDERGLERKYDLMFFIPEAPHIENKILYGVAPKERAFYHLFKYLDDKQDVCTPYRLNLGEFITVTGFELPDVEDLLETERKKSQEEGFIAESDAKNKRVVDLSFASRLKHEGYSGGAVIRDDEYCFAGIPYIRKTGEETFDLKMIPLPEILKFVSEAMGVDINENSDFGEF